MKSSLPLAPGPSLLSVVLAILKVGRKPLELFTLLARHYGPAARIGRGRWQVLLISDPELIRQVLVVESDSYCKDRGLDATRPVLGEGLLTSEGEFHKRQRRLTQPAFHRSRLPAYAQIMVECADRRAASWRDGQSVDLCQELSGLTLDVVARTLFGAEIGHEAAAIGEALDFCLTQLTPPRMAILPLLHRFPLKSTLLFRKHSGKLKSTIDALIAQRRRGPAGGGDLLSMLINAHEGDDRMSDVQLRDECLTLFLAGHETTANALAWTFYLLELYPEVASRVHEELGRVLATRPVTLEDLPLLEYTDRVVRESMRLYPPSWTLGRRAVKATSLGGYRVPLGSTVVLSQWVMHRQSAHFPDPERFHPDRWTPQFTQKLARCAYFPFGAGVRICVAESFARSETLLVLATLARAWEFRREPGREVVPQPYITLRPRGGLPGQVWRR